MSIIFIGGLKTYRYYNYKTYRYYNLIEIKTEQAYLSIAQVGLIKDYYLKKEVFFTIPIEMFFYQFVLSV